MSASVRLLPLRLILSLLSSFALWGCRASGVAEPSPPINANINQNSPQLSTQPQQVDLGLSTLPSPRQVISATPIGKPDPFSPPSQEPIPGPPPQLLNKVRAALEASKPPDPSIELRWLESFLDFNYTGYILVGNTSKALVSYKGDSGEITVGSRGGTGSSARLLPSGWTVRSINRSNGLLTLTNSNRTIRLYPGSTKKQLSDYLETILPASPPSGAASLP